MKVIWDRQDYIRDCENQLTDVNLYGKKEGVLVTATNKKVRKVWHNEHVSFDVAGLYTHIPHEVGIGIMKEFLNQMGVKDISLKYLCDLAKIILKNNFFEIGEEVYHQLLATVIGIKFAPTYASLLMIGLEKKIFERN